MRPKYFSYTPADDNLTGFKSNATGATWTLTATSAGDGLAHLVTIRNDSATNHSAKTAVLTGTDADGRALTETVSLPDNAGTTTSTKYFKTLTSVVPSASIGSDTMDIGWKDTCVTPSYVVDRPRKDFQTSFNVDISGTINFTVQSTLDDIYSYQENACSWANHTTVASATADAASNYVVPIVAMRVLINSLTAGATLKLSVIGG